MDRWVGGLGWEGVDGAFFIFCAHVKRHNVRLLPLGVRVWVASGAFPGRSDGARGGMRWGVGWEGGRGERGDWDGGLGWGVGTGQGGRTGGGGCATIAGGRDAVAECGWETVIGGGELAFDGVGLAVLLEEWDRGVGFFVLCLLGAAWEGDYSYIHWSWELELELVNGGF